MHPNDFPQPKEGIVVLALYNSLQWDIWLPSLVQGAGVHICAAPSSLVTHLRLIFVDMHPFLISLLSILFCYLFYFALFPLLACPNRGFCAEDIQSQSSKFIYATSN